MGAPTPKDKDKDKEKKVQEKKEQENKEEEKKWAEEDTRTRLDPLWGGCGRGGAPLDATEEAQWEGEVRQSGDGGEGRGLGGGVLLCIPAICCGGSANGRVPTPQPAPEWSRTVQT